MQNLRQCKIWLRNTTHHVVPKKCYNIHHKDQGNYSITFQFCFSFIERSSRQIMHSCFPHKLLREKVGETHIEIQHNWQGKFFKISFIITFLVFHYIFKFTFSYSHNFIEYKNANVKYKTHVNLSQIYMQNVCTGCIKDFCLFYT